jgi:hypothetical protein
MRHLLLASITTALLCGSALGGIPTIPAIPPVNVTVPPTAFTINTAVDVNTGGGSNTLVHGGPVTLAQSLTLKLSTFIATSTSFAPPGINVGFSVP